jgi:L-lactate dehydrogenase (cytochrome)
MSTPLAQLAARELRAAARELPSRLDPGARVARRLDRAVTIEDLRRAARRAIPQVVFDFVDGAANDEATLAANRRDLDALALAPRALVDVSRIDPSTTVLGRKLALPLLGAPTGLTGLVNPLGEPAIARALHAAGSLYVVSAMASHTVEEVRAATDGPLWFQLYVFRDRGFAASLIERAAATGCEALVVTVDVPVAGARERDARNGFGIPPRLTPRSVAQGLLRPRWSADFIRRPRIEVAHAAGRGDGAGDAISLLGYVNSQFDPTLSWATLGWVREHWTGPLVIKGILRPDDAVRAVDQVGADAVIVSNHGGRQLDHAVSGIAALPAIADAVGDRAEVLMDGGIRRGSDILCALALGARAVLAARPFVYGLAAGGAAGAARAAAILGGELERALALSGAPTVADLDSSFVVSRTNMLAP